MTDVSRGARTRRGGRGPGWLLLTSLLVLAILASSTLVFTDRVELLRLAVILSLWAAAAAAFVTVIYRRQSELDQARARDMKFVYDLQLDREISARREYELSVESNLRRTLSREIRAEAADEMAGLRAELAALRSQLEVMLGTDLGHRPALGSERVAVPMPAAPGRVESSRLRMVTQEVVTVAREAVIENPIIDVPEEPLVEPSPAPVVATPPPLEAPPLEATRRQGSHRRSADAATDRRSGPAEPVGPAPAQPVGPAPTQPYVPEPARQPDVPWRPPETRLGRHSANGSGSTEPGVPPADVAVEAARGRHWVPPEHQDGPVNAGRHRGPEEAATESEAEELKGQHADGNSFADLMARLQVNPSSSGGRRRRED